MNPEREDQALVQAWLKEPVWMPESDLPRLAALVHDTPQRHGWLPPAVSGRIPSMFNATRFVVAGLIVAMFGGFLVTDGLQSQRTDGPLAAAVSASATAVIDPTTAPTAELPEDVDWPPAALPDGATTGTLDTPRGPAPWVRLPEPVAGFADAGLARSVLPWPSGYAALIHGDDDDHPQLLVSEDGVRWHVEPLPLPAGARQAELIHADGSYLLLGTGAAAAIWRSDDGRTWRQLDGNGVWPPGPDGLRWRSSLVTAPATAGGRTLISASFDGRLPRGRLGLGTNCRHLTRVSTEVFRCSKTRSAADDRLPRTIRFEVEESGLQVLDDDTGERLGSIAGGDLGTIARIASARSNRIDERVTLLVEGDTIERIQPPWQGRNVQWRGRNVHVRSDGDSFYAFEFTEDGVETWTVWQSDDGRPWTDLGAPVPDGPVGGFGWTSIHPRADGSTITFWSPDGPDSEEVASFDLQGGASWTAAPEGNPDGTSRLRLDSGWFAADSAGYDLRGGDDLWVHVDGEWVSLAPMGIDSGGDRCGADIGAVGDLTFISVRAGCGADRGSGARWVLKLDANP